MAESGDQSRVDRRGFLAAAGIGAGVVAAGAIGARLAGAGQSTMGKPEPVPAADQAVRDLFGDLAAGGTIGDCKVERVHGVHMGAIPVVMICARGSRFQVDVLRREGHGPDGVGNTSSLSLFVSNRGDGRTRTDEQQGLAAMTLAAALAEREQEGARAPALMTHSQRLEAYPRAAFAVPL